MSDEWQYTFDELRDAGLTPNIGGTLLKLYEQPIQAMVLYRPGKSSHPVHIQTSRQTYSLSAFERLSPYLVRSKAKRDIRGWDFYDVKDWSAFKNVVLSFSQVQDSRGILTGGVSEAAKRMAATALTTTQYSNGQTVLKIIKDKHLRFDGRDEFEKYIDEILESQSGRCAVTALPLSKDDTCSDPDLLASLDRIDSNGHYERGNLQIVCRFINQWKSDSDDANFKRLINLVRN